MVKPRRASGAREVRSDAQIGTVDLPVGGMRMTLPSPRVLRDDPTSRNDARGRAPPRPYPTHTSHSYTSKERREAMATLSVLKFNDPYGADRVLLALQGLQEQQMINLEDAAIVSWPQGNRKPKTRQLHGGSGALGGAFWGFLFGLIFFVPFLGAAIGAA